MEHKIKTLADLGAAIITLTEKQLRQPPRIVQLDGDRSERVSSMHIMEEPFLQHKHDPSIVGYPSELRLKSPKEHEDFKVLEPVGTVYLYLTK